MVESRQEECLAIIAAFTVFAFIFVGTRVYSRYLGSNFGWDDYLVIGAMVILFGQTIAIWKSLMGTIRASIIVFLWRMKDNRRRIRYSLYAVFWINVLYTFSTSIVNIVQCTPIRYAWARPALDTVSASGKIIPGGKCIASRTFILSSCALSIFMDLIIIPIPSIMVWNLQMDRKTKLLVVVVMSLGWIATGVSVGRFIVYYYRFAPTMTDRTWDIGVSISIAEPAVHIMTACAPATKCLFRYLFPYFARRSTRRSTRKEESTFYEDRSRQRKGSRGFAFGIGEVESGHEEIGMRAKEAQETGKEVHGYGMKRLSTVDSREELVEAEDGKSGMVEAEPQHCLGVAK